MANDLESYYELLDELFVIYVRPSALSAAQDQIVYS